MKKIGNIIIYLVLFLGVLYGMTLMLIGDNPIVAFTIFSICFFSLILHYEDIIKLIK